MHIYTGDRETDIDRQTHRDRDRDRDREIEPNRQRLVGRDYTLTKVPAVLALSSLK